jgi:hypothetical protein
MKLDIGETLELVRETLAAEHVSEDIIKKTLATIQTVAKEIKTEEKAERTERPRKEYCGVIFETTDSSVFKGHIFQLDSGVESHTIIDKIKTVANDYGNSKKGRKNPAKTILDAIELPANKFFKSLGINRKSRETFYVMKSDNKLTSDKDNKDTESKNP